MKQAFLQKYLPAFYLLVIFCLMALVTALYFQNRLQKIDHQIEKIRSHEQ